MQKCLMSDYNRSSVATLVKADNYYPQGWAINSTPGIYQWYLSVNTGLENTPKVADIGKHWSTELSHLEITAEISIKLT